MKTVKKSILSKYENKNYFITFENHQEYILNDWILSKYGSQVCIILLYYAQSMTTESKLSAIDSLYNMFRCGNGQGKFC